MQKFTIDEVMKLDKIQKISKIGSIFYIPANSTQLFALTKDNGAFQEIICNDSLVFPRDIYISMDDIRRLIKQLKEKDYDNLFYEDLYFNWYRDFDFIRKSINQSINNPIIYHEDNIDKSDQYLTMYNMKADDGTFLLQLGDTKILLTKSMLPTTKSNSISVNVFPYIYNKKLVRFFIYKNSSDVLIENFIVI